MDTEYKSENTAPREDHVEIARFVTLTDDYAFWAKSSHKS